MPYIVLLVSFFLLLLCGCITGLCCGAAAALFLTLLDIATTYRQQHTWIIWLLPCAGLLLGYLIEHTHSTVKGGINAVVDSFHAINNHKLSWLMLPFVLIATLISHLFGASVGREGVAIQMGASLAEQLATLCKTSMAWRRRFLAAGIAGGIGAVFGTPIAGMFFCLELLVIDASEIALLLVALIAALVGHHTAVALGVQHEVFAPIDLPVWNIALSLRLLMIGILLAIPAIVFIQICTTAKTQCLKYIPHASLRLCLGGVLTVILWQIIQTPIYAGLSQTLLAAAFVDPSLPIYAFMIKATFTIIAIATGFIGGEVTPLLVIGALFGNTFAQLLGLPLSFSAAICMMSFFATVSNAPLTMSVMAVEIFGVSILPHMLLVCMIAYYLSGHTSIYSAQQRLLLSKYS